MTARKLPPALYALGSSGAHSKGENKMLESEWLAMGYQNGIITDVPLENQVIFKDAYLGWFRMKINTIKSQSVDRIECTYNKYYANSDIINMPVHQINEVYCYQFLNDILLKYKTITKKEYGRIYQIINNVLSYAYDCNIGYAKSIDWHVVKRYIAEGNIKDNIKTEHCISSTDRISIINAVLNDNVYPEKRSASLCVCLNFYLGLRIGELASITWNDIDFNTRKLYVHTTQTKSYERDNDGKRIGVIAYHDQDTTKTPHGVRYIPLVNEAVYILMKLKEYHIQQGYEDKHIAYDGTDTILSKSIERTIVRLNQLCDVLPFNSHLIRKTFATTLHENGVPTKIISDLMGHAEIRTTEKFYIISTGNDITYLREMIQEALSVKN